MTTLREAAQQALEALEYAQQGRECPSTTRQAITALRALKAALAGPAQEPVAWIYQNMYTEQEYLVWKKGTGGRNWRPLYTAPPQRKPLTEEEIKDCFHAARNAKLGASKDNSKHRLSVVEIARAVERAHGIGEAK